MRKRCLAYLCMLALVFAMLADGTYTYRVSAAGTLRESVFSEEELIWIEEAKAELKEILKERTVMALVYLSDYYAVRELPDRESAVVVNVPSGQPVQIQDVEITGNYEAWEYVSFYCDGQPYSGYVERTHLACSDEVFLEWEDWYGMNPATRSVMSISGGDVQIPSDVAQFPESYQKQLTALKEAHPNWIFVKMNTNLDWNVVVENEMVKGRNLIETSFPEHMWDGIHSPGWGFVTQDTLEYYLDPRNGLTESGIFQYEQLVFNESYHTEEALQEFLNGSFMEGIIPDTVLTYALTFFATGREIQVSPFHLACRVYQEQGREGGSPLISGTYPGYEGYYNYFNIGASGTTREEVIVSGLQKAKEQNWYNGYYSIYGGAKILSANYILQGQDTLYLQKFDVENNYNGMYWHQYMQNVCAPTSEAKNVRKVYSEAGSLEKPFVFKIPVYNNMPQENSPEPEVSYTVSLTAPEGYNDPTVYIDGVAVAATVENGQYVVDVSDGDSATAVMYQYNEKNIPVGMHVWELAHDGKGYEATEVPELNDLLTYHGFSIRITGKSGIRFKTGISKEVREKLLSAEGAGGYTLKEYGTLVMNNANRDKYPMIKGGEKVKSGLSYGMNESDILEDKIFETIDGRHRFTAVLVGLPVNQYKTEFAFRGYAILTKGGKDITLYGPVVARSIYNLAERLLNTGYYKEGSSAYLFMQQLIKDADSLENQ